MLFISVVGFRDCLVRVAKHVEMVVWDKRARKDAGHARPPEGRRTAQEERQVNQHRVKRTLCFMGWDPFLCFRRMLSAVEPVTVLPPFTSPQPRPLCLPADEPRTIGLAI